MFDQGGGCCFCCYKGSEEFLKRAAAKVPPDIIMAVRVNSGGISWSDHAALSTEMFYGGLSVRFKIPECDCCFHRFGARKHIDTVHPSVIMFQGDQFSL